MTWTGIEAQLTYFLSLFPYVLIVFAVTHLVFILCESIERYYCSDLYSVPGPSAPLWKRYIVGNNMFAATVHKSPIEIAEQLNSWRKEYGPTFALRDLFGEVTVWITSEESLRTMTVSKVAAFEKSNMWKVFLTPLVGKDSIFLSNGERHARLRKIIAPAVQSDAVAAVGNIFLEHGKRLAQKCLELGNSGVDITHTVRSEVFAVIFESCFGTEAVNDALTEKLCESYITMLTEPTYHYLKSMLLPTLFPFIDPMKVTWRGDLKIWIKDTLTKLAKEQLQKRSNGEKGGGALLSLMLDEKSQQLLTENEMAETVQSFLVAGQATTSTAICWTLYFLAKNEEWQGRVLEEVNNMEDKTDLKELEGLGTLDRVVRETIRLYPPLYSMHRRTVEPVNIDGYRIPKGVTIRVPVLAIQRNKEIWGKDADEFNPDRFLHPSDRLKTRMFWCAFLYGPRGCLGQRFALLEIKAFVAQVVQRLHLYVKPLEDAAPDMSGVLGLPNNMKIYFGERK